VTPQTDQNFTVTLFDVEDWKLVGLVGVNTAVSECDPGASVLTGPIATPAVTGTGAPRRVAPSLN